MRELTLSQLRNFHADLRTLAAAGLPIDFSDACGDDVSPHTSNRLETNRRRSNQPEAAQLQEGRPSTNHTVSDQTVFGYTPSGQTEKAAHDAAANTILVTTPTSQTSAESTYREQPNFHSSSSDPKVQFAQLESIEIQLRDMLRIAHKSGLKHDLRSEETMLRGALEQPNFATNKYRACLDAWLLCDGDPGTLTPFVFQPLTAEASAKWRTIGLLPLIVWFTIGYAVYGFVSLYVFPKVLALAAQVQYSSTLFEWIEFANQYRALLLLIIPVVGLCGIWCAAYFIRRIATTRPAKWTQHYTVSSQVARLLASDATLPDAMSLGRVTRDANTHHPKHIATDRTAPPLIRWAQEQGQADPNNALPAFEFASSVYQDFRRLCTDPIDRRPTSRIALFAGGVIALAIGLALFLPVIELLWFNASVHAVQ